MFFYLPSNLLTRLTEETILFEIIINIRDVAGQAVRNVKLSIHVFLQTSQMVANMPFCANCEIHLPVNYYFIKVTIYMKHSRLCEKHKERTN